MVQPEEMSSHDCFDQHCHNNHHTLRKEKLYDGVSHPPWCRCKHQIRHPKNTFLQVKRQSEKVKTMSV